MSTRRRRSDPMGYSVSTRRRALELVREVLESARGGIRKTRIMYKADLNHKQLKRYLNHCLKLQLIRFDHHTSLYTTTEKGRRFLDALNQYRQAEDELGSAHLKIVEVIGESERATRLDGPSKRRSYAKESILRDASH